MTAVDLLASVVRGDVVEWPAGIVAEGSFVDAAVDHSVEALVVWQLRRAGTFDRWPPAIQTRLAQLAREEALLEAGRERELRGLLAALHDAGVRCVAFKGAALAYSRYPEPWRRPRNDNDLLVPADDVAAAGRVMKALGYEPPVRLSDLRSLPTWDAKLRLIRKSRCRVRSTGSRNTRRRTVSSCLHSTCTGSLAGTWRLIRRFVH